MHMSLSGLKSNIPFWEYSYIPDKINARESQLTFVFADFVLIYF